MTSHLGFHTVFLETPTNLASLFLCSVLRVSAVSSLLLRETFSLSAPARPELGTSESDYSIVPRHGELAGGVARTPEVVLREILQLHLAAPQRGELLLSL